jgi:hypothetical protein
MERERQIETERERERERGTDFDLPHKPVSIKSWKPKPLQRRRKVKNRN